MTKTAKGLKKAIALVLTVLMVGSGFAFSVFAAGTVTLTAKANQSADQIEVTPAASEGYTIKTIEYSVSPEPSKEKIVGTDNTCTLQGLVKDTEYTITATGTFTDETTFTATVKSTVDKYTRTAPTAIYATNVTRTSVTVNSIAGAEYTIDNWATTHAADSENANVFDGLTAGKTYTVKARYAATDDYKASAEISCNVTPSNGVTVANKTSGSLTVNAVSYPDTGIIVNTNGKTATVTATPTLSVKETAAGEYTLYTTTAGTTYTITVKSGTDTATFTIEALSADAKAEKAAPTGIAVEDITATSIKVTKVDGVEYVCLPSSEKITDATVYGTACEFTGLTENTEYTVYARYAETDDSYASEPATIKATPCSSSITYTADTTKNSVSIEVKFPSTDSVKTVTVTPEGTPAASVANEKSGSGTYTCDIFNIVPGTKYTVTVTLTTGKVITTNVLIKSTQAAPKAPTLSSRTKSTIVINSVVGTEYACVLHGKDVPVTGWKAATATTLTFDGLSDGTVYDIYARLPETETAQTSPASTALSVTTIKASENVVPAAVTFSNVSKTEVIVTKLAGYEYKLYIDGSESSATWQDSNKFTGLTADTTYYVVQRVKVDETVQEVNPTSAAKKVKTNTGDPYIIDTASLSTFTLSTDNGSFTITATAAMKSATDKQWGDIQYIPVKYEIKKDNTVVKTGSFTTSDSKTYTASGSVSDEGDYTVVVTYEKQRYENEGTTGYVAIEYVTQQKTFTVIAKWQYYLQKALSFLGTTLPQYMMKGFDWLRKNSSGISSFISILLSGLSSST